MAVSVKVITDGPLMVKGECEMQDGQGNAMPPKGGDTIFLCRCGSSANKPYCDGTHKRTAQTEEPGKLYWYDAERNPRPATDIPGIASD